MFAFSSGLRRGLIVLAAVAALAACGKSLSGSYEGSGGKYTFESGGKGIVDIGFGKFGFTYEIDGSNVKITMAQGGPALIFAIKDDQTLIGPMDMPYKKK